MRSNSESLSVGVAKQRTADSADGKPNEAHQQEARFEADQLRKNLAVAVDQEADDEEQPGSRCLAICIDPSSAN